MPHITVEYSANVAKHHDIDALVSAVHAAAVGSPILPLAGLRTRAARRDHYQVATGAEDLAMIAIAVRIGPGRDAAAKTELIEALLDAAENHITADDGPLAIAWSIELNEIDADFRINRNRVRTRLARTQVEQNESKN